MDHINCRENLSAYIDGELPALERALVEAHLADCPDCRAVLGQLRSVSGLVKKHAMEPVPAGLEKKVLGGARQPARPWLKPVLAFSAAAAAVLVVFNVTKTPQETYSPDLGFGSRAAMEMSPAPAAPAGETASAESEAATTAPMEPAAADNGYVRPASVAAVRGSMGQAKFAARSAAPLGAGAGGSLAGAASSGLKALPVSEFSGPVCVYVADPAVLNEADGAMYEAFTFLQKTCPDSAQTRPGAVFIKKDGTRSAVTPRDCSYGFIFFDGVQDPRVVTDPRAVPAEYRKYFGLP